jgi:hypothetical protein
LPLLTEVHGHHHFDEIPLDLLPLGIPHRNECYVPPEMVEAENRGEQFPLQIPLIRLQSGPESLFEDEGHHVRIRVPGIVFASDDDFLDTGIS